MFRFPLIKPGFVLLNWSYHVGRHTRVKKSVRGYCRKIWSILDRLLHRQSQKECSKGVLRYETLRTRARDAGEDVEKGREIRSEESEVVLDMQ